VGGREAGAHHGDTLGFGIQQDRIQIRHSREAELLKNGRKLIASNVLDIGGKRTGHRWEEKWLEGGSKNGLGVLIHPDARVAGSPTGTRVAARAKVRRQAAVADTVAGAVWKGCLQRDETE
jgi:hypothetical protein